MLRIVAAALCLVIGLPATASAAVPARIIADPIGLGIDASAYVLMEGHTGQILAAHNAHVLRPPASTTKALTALIALETLPLARTLTASRRAAEAREGSAIGFEVGERHTVEDLLRALLLKSANDAAIVLAEGIDGTVERFVARMNRRARALGAERSMFANPHGLHDPRHLATARDLALIARAAMRNEDFARLVAMRTAPYAGPTAPIELVNRNRLLWQLDGADGIKTGFVNESGQCLIGSASRDGRRLITVLLDAPFVFRDTRALIGHGFAKTRLQTLVRRGETLARYGAVGALGEVEARAAQDVSWTMPVGARASVKPIATVGLRAPVDAEQIIGEAEVRVDDEIIGHVPLIADRALRRESVLTSILRWVFRWFGRASVGLRPRPAAAASSPFAAVPAERFAVPLVVTDAAGVTHRFVAPPRRVVSIAPSVTEMLYAVGAEDQVVGVSAADDHPTRVRDKPRVGGFQVDDERVAAQRPDLVIGVLGLQADVLARLRRAGHRVFAVDGRSLEATAAAIQVVGRVMGRPEAAARIAAGLRAQVAAVRARVAPKPIPAVYVEVWDQPFLTVGRDTLLDDLIRIAGGRNVFADVRGWPQVAEEEIVRRSPDVVLLLGKTAARVRARAAWRSVPALKNGRVYELDASLVTRPGPRLGEGAEHVARLLYPAHRGDATPR
ncbi:MAG: hypothetical protein FJX78_06950 [Armatimonadetes bacterium]|nr:hypothetical protein [Armatimonadota bacterium]